MRALGFEPKKEEIKKMVRFISSDPFTLFDMRLFEFI